MFKHTDKKGAKTVSNECKKKAEDLSISLEWTLKDKEEMNIHGIKYVIMSIYDSNKNGDNIRRGYDE